MFLTLFRGAGAASRVFTVNPGGKFTDKGVGWSGLVGPFTTLAVVPTTPQAIPLIIEARTADNQAVTVTGTVQVSLEPAAALRSFDFSVDIRRGGATGAWQRELQTTVAQILRSTVVGSITKLDVTQVVVGQAVVEEAIQQSASLLAGRGITLLHCSIERIDPTDDEVGEAIGADERESLLMAADAARHNRQMASVANTRQVKEAEAATALALEKERANLIAQQAKNGQAQAEAEATATKTRLEALKDSSPAALIGAAFHTAAAAGRLSNMNLTTEVLAALTEGMNGR